jgi:hypothetical protein
MTTMKKIMVLVIAALVFVACETKNNGYKPDTKLLPGEWFLSATSDLNGTSALPNVSYIFKNDIVFYEKFNDTLQYGTWSISNDTILHLQYTTGINNYMFIKNLTATTLVVESQTLDKKSQFTFSRNQTNTPQ